MFTSSIERAIGVLTLIVGILALLAAVLIGVGSIAWTEVQSSRRGSLPVQPRYSESTPQGERIATDNPSTTTYRLNRAEFDIDEIIEPNGGVGDPVLDDPIIFTNKDYDPRRRQFRKDLSHIKFTASQPTNLLIRVVDPEHAGRRYEGTLRLFYDGHEPIEMANQSIPVTRT